MIERPIISRTVYRIETNRLVIRCWDPKDAPLLQEVSAANKAHLLPFLGWARDEPQTVDQKIDLLRRFRSAFDRHDEFSFAIFNEDESRLLGSTCFLTRPMGNALEIGYWLHKDYTGRGLITESTAALTKVGFDVYGLDRIDIHCSVANPGSAAIPRKLGYTHEGTRRQMAYSINGLTDCMVWTLLRDEYPTTPSAASDVRAYDAVGCPLL